MDELIEILTEVLRIAYGFLVQLVLFALGSAIAVTVAVLLAKYVTWMIGWLW